MNAAQYLGETVRVYYNYADEPAVIGKLVAIVPEPVLVIDDEDGVRHHVASSLRIEVLHTEWRPA